MAPQARKCPCHGVPMKRWGNRWRCRIKANPLGYREKEEQAAFDPLCTIEVASA